MVRKNCTPWHSCVDMPLNHYFVDSSKPLTLWAKCRHNDYSLRHSKKNSYHLQNTALPHKQDYSNRKSRLEITKFYISICNIQYAFGWDNSYWYIVIRWKCSDCDPGSIWSYHENASVNIQICITHQKILAIMETVTKSPQVELFMSPYHTPELSNIILNTWQMPSHFYIKTIDMK